MSPSSRRKVATPRSTSACGTPMGTTTTRPACSAAVWSRSDRFRPAKVGVIVARTAGPGTTPSSEPRPDGTSRAMTGSPSRPAARLSCSMIWAVTPRAAPVVPVPRRASTTRSASAKARANRLGPLSSPTSSTAPRQRARACAASPFTSPRRPARRTRTRAPLARRCRAATNPSPPLLPRPQSTSTRLPRTGAHSRAMMAAAPLPAFSMRRGPGMPSVSMARASRARISAAVKMGCMLPPARRGQEIRPLREEVAEHDGVGLARGRARHARQLDVKRLLRAREHAARLRGGGGVAKGVHGLHEDLQTRGLGLAAEIGIADELEERLHLPGVLLAEADGGDLHAPRRVLMRVAMHFDVEAQWPLARLGDGAPVGLEDAAGCLRLALGARRGAGHALRGTVHVVAAPLCVELAEARGHRGAEAGAPGELEPDHVRGAVGGAVGHADDVAWPSLDHAEVSRSQIHRRPRGRRSWRLDGGHGFLASDDPRAARQPEREGEDETSAGPT